MSQAGAYISKIAASLSYKYEDIIRLKYLIKGVFNLGKAQKPRIAVANQGFLQRSIG